MATQKYRIKIDELPEEVIDAESPSAAARATAALLETSDALRKLADDEPVEIKRPDGTPWGRNLTIGAFRNGEIDFDSGPEGPIHAASVAGP